MGAAGPRLSVVTPLFNEAANVPELLAEVRSALESTGWSYEVLCVDDASSDGTAAAVRSAAAGDGRIRLIRFAANRGQSAAMHAGIMAALGQVIVTIDGDLQNDPADIPSLVRALDRADLVCGWRVRRRDSRTKRMASRIGNWFRRRALKDPVHDTGCSLKAFRREVRHTLVPFRAMHRFIPALVGGAGYRVVEMPVNHRPRRHGRSNYGVSRRAWEGLRDLRGMRWWLRRRVFYDIVEDTAPAPTQDGPAE